MRQLFVAAVATAALAAFAATPAQAGKVEVKGLHICCPQCEKGITTILGKVDGVSDAKADKATKTATFTTKDDKATAAALAALVDGGFCGTATDDGKEVKVVTPTAKKGDKADEVTITNVHVCCGQCKTAIKGLFKDAKAVDFPDKTSVKVTGTGIDKGEALEALNKAGFGGKIEK
jgi:periplasmic mercuric ion binding protein